MIFLYVAFNGPIHTDNNIAQYDLYSLVCTGNCEVCKGGIGDRYCTNCQKRRMIGQYTTQLPVQTKLYRPYCAILLPVCIGPLTNVNNLIKLYGGREPYLTNKDIDWPNTQWQ